MPSSHCSFWGARQVVVYEFERAAKALEAHLDVDAGRILDVVTRRLHQARDLPQLGQNPPGPFGERGVVEEHLPRETRRKEIAVILRVSLPGAYALELENAAPDARVERGTLAPLAVGQARGIDRREAAGEPPKIPDVGVDGGPAQVLEQVVMKVNAVECRVGGVFLMQPREVLIDEMR
jgi:hypothetical protein